MHTGIMMGMLLTLLNKKKVTRQYFSEKFEISLRSVSRYCDAMLESGIPLVSVCGLKGGITIADDFVLDRLLLDEKEKERVLNALQKTKADFGDEINDSIIQKFKIMKSDESSEKSFITAGALIIDGTAWHKPGTLRKKISIINKSIDESRVLCFSYIDKNEFSSVRKVAPHSLVFKDSIWYAYCWCYNRNDFRLFKLSRMKDLILSRESFTKKETDVYAKLQEQSFYEPEIPFKITFSSTILSEIEDWLGSDCIVEENNQYVAKSTYPGGNHLLKKLMSFGSSVSVLSPQSLIDDIKAEVKRIYEKY